MGLGRFFMLGQAKKWKRSGFRTDRWERLGQSKMTTNWTIDGVKEALGARKISARELVAEFYARIEARNPELNAFLTLSPERARRQTDKIDALVAGGKPLPPLAGVPVAIKDVISTRGIKTTCGSKIL